VGQPILISHPSNGKPVFKRFVAYGVALKDTKTVEVQLIPPGGSAATAPWVSTPTIRIPDPDSENPKNWVYWRFLFSEPLAEGTDYTLNVRDKNNTARTDTATFPVKGSLNDPLTISSPRTTNPLTKVCPNFTAYGSELDDTVISVTCTIMSGTTVIATGTSTIDSNDNWTVDFTNITNTGDLTLSVSDNKNPSPQPSTFQEGGRACTPS
jgi:hypothetical protein